ncbi:hypothetical protein JTE90_001005 [Oedothorax gibbosus]|uniref:Uncharacterized protein n=1 Tax=Oedothorax gibbosus TaxID=931172 RepID=A0AAV6TRY2_9ARAC|nr:hypothetical protein JTE90_001005 [Oedothorax gibbosus]
MSSDFKKSHLFLKHNQYSPMPTYCVPLKELRNHFSKDSSPTGNSIVEKLDNLSTFFDTHVQYPLSMAMRNVLVGEFIGPLLDYAQNQGRKSSTSNVDNLVEIKRKDIEINKLKESLTSAQDKIDKLEEELGKEREASRTFLENGVNLASAREEIDKQSDKKVATIKSSFQSHLEELDRLEKDRQTNCEIIIDKLIKGRSDELNSTKLILEQYDARCSENKDMINKVSGEMENLRDSVTSALEAFRLDIGEAKVSSAPAPPSFADVVATGGSKENVIIFVDLPVEGEGVKDFRGFKNALGAILSKESCKCSGIYETKKGAKLTAPSLSDANSIKEIIGKTESLLTLKVNIMTKEPPKFIIKYTNLKDEKALLEQLVLKNPFFSTTSPKVLFKIDINKMDQYHWVIEIPPSAFKAVESLGFVYLGLGKHRLLEFVSIRHCKNCLEYGHTTKNVPTQGEGVLNAGVKSILSHALSDAFLVTKKTVQMMALWNYLKLIIELLLIDVRSTGNRSVLPDLV